MNSVNKFLQTYLCIFISIFSVEVIFKLISGFNLFAISMIRIILGINIIAIFFSFILTFTNKIVRNIVICLLTFASAFYACIQAGFFNFLGVYMSVQTSSQLGAVKDYIGDFLLSFKPTYFLTFIPFIVLLVYLILTRKREFKSSDKLEYFAIFLLVFNFSSFFYYKTLKSSAFQDSYATSSSYNLFLTASNPSLAINQFGSTTFALLDIRQALFPIEIEDDYISVLDEEEDEIDEYSRIIDDTSLDLLIKEETDDKKNNINKYFKSRSITPKNDMTGLFKDKNLIVIMMESANDILLDDKYFPNFNKLVNEGWYFANNYSPRNACATMNNEFSGMTSIYSIYNTCTASKYKNNTYYTSMFNLFNNLSYKTFSAHNYTEAYYPRKKIHTNMGSGKYYGVQSLGIKYSNEYRNWSNDDDFMKSVLNILDEYDATNNKFMTWLTTVSSHQPYSVSSIQGDKYLSMTKNTKYPKDVRRLMSKYKILDNAIGILIDGLTERGILDDTVIVLYGDHYPYGITTRHLNKVLDYNTSKDMNAERVPLVIYNSEIDPQVYYDYTSYINLLPTIANLFDLEYDPRLYLGDDYFSDDYKSMVVFADGSWKNEYAYYDANKSKIKYYSSFEYSSDEIAMINKEINTRMNISTKVIKSNYFEYLKKQLDYYDEKQITTCPLSGEEENNE